MVPAPFALPWRLDWALREAYARPERAYHHYGHVIELLAEYAQVQHLLADPVSVALAILFHDAVYVPGRSDNEAESAALARTLVPAHLPDLEADIARVETLILMTARHGALGPGDVDPDASLFLDCDMAILGAADERYDAYSRAIATEYGHMEADAYRAGRARFVEHLLTRDRIFLSERFRARLEAQARKNLRRELASLAS